ncbi:MAG: hypothetical protein KDB27_06210 [Planctomycetales bacterium]|nr:hypothetical protein [Planctomycetales bacterium]
MRMRFAFSFMLVCLFCSMAHCQQLAPPISCSLATCHGSTNASAPPWNTAVSQWATNDPHANAGLTLLSPRSLGILQRLVRTEAEVGSEAYDQAINATRKELCITCHTTVESADASAEVPHLLGFGVTCDACHTNSQVWLTQHVESGWKRKSFAEFNDMTITANRATTCVKCHVGSSRPVVRDVNHDLIAAGHPMLRFDLLIHNARLEQTRHWDKTLAESNENADELTVRQVGRAAAIIAATDLSVHRANTPTSPFPEFADYDCFACHSPVKSTRELPRQSAQLNLAWNPWFAHGIGTRAGEEPLALTMAAIRNSNNARSRIAAAAAAVNAAYQDRLKASNFLPAAEHEVLLSELTFPRWHDAARITLTLEAKYAETPDGREKLKRLREILQLEGPEYTPSMFRIDFRSNSNHATTFSPADFVGEVKQLLKIQESPR